MCLEGATKIHLQYFNNPILPIDVFEVKSENKPPVPGIVFIAYTSDTNIKPDLEHYSEAKFVDKNEIFKFNDLECVDGLKRRIDRAFKEIQNS